MNTFGHALKVTLFGESHGGVMGVMIDGVIPGLPIDKSDFIADLSRRKPGSTGTTHRIEKDEPEIVSGLLKGYTTGAPVTVLLRNENFRREDYERFRYHPRPSHADYAASEKYSGFNDPLGGGMFSGRLTALLVIAGTLAKKVLGPEVRISAKTIEIGGDREERNWPDILQEALQAGDSVGGLVECHVTGIPAGWGSPFFDSVESIISHIVFSIPAVKGIEFGSGFCGAAMKGSENNDPIIDAAGRTSSNHSGGINGGISNGNPLEFRVAVKPTPSISIPQETFNFDTGTTETLVIEGRHDTCIALRMPVIVEAAAAIALAQFKNYG